MPPVGWSDEVDEVLVGDLTTALAYVTPAGGAVVTAVAPIGLHDRAAGTAGFTTSLGFGRKLERIKANPRIALAFHAREHGWSTSPLYVLVQGRVADVTSPDTEFMLTVIAPKAEPYLEPARRGRLFWDRWLREYYVERVLVTVAVERVVAWPDLTCDGEPEVAGAALPAAPAAPQRPPRGGVGPRVDVARAARKLAGQAHLLLAHVQDDGVPTVVPVRLAGSGADGLALEAAGGLLPAGGRRAGLLGHTYQPHLVGLAVRQHTGWLEVDPAAGGSRATYAPHTQHGYRAPANKTLLLLLNGLIAKQGVRVARRERRERLLGAPSRPGPPS
jgi:Pyridoxamine 5'-phosphate oxidase